MSNAMPPNVPHSDRRRGASDSTRTAQPRDSDDSATTGRLLLPLADASTRYRFPVETPYKPQRSGWLWVGIAVGALAITVMFGIVLFVGVRYVAANRSIGANTIPTSFTITATVNPLAVAANAPLPTFDAPTVNINVQPWNGKERFTILLMGLDKRPGDPGTAFRTDTMILVSFDPQTNSIGMLSVPRDMYVTIPSGTVVGSSYGEERINAAYVIGESARPGSGPQLAMQAVQYNLGMRVNDYVVFDFEAVINAVDSVGGVDVDVATPVNDPLYPDMNDGYDPLYIPAGHIHMDGNLALKYARSRHGNSDLERAKHQQQIILALRDKILAKQMIPQLLIDAPGLWSSLSRNVRSGLSLDQLLHLAVYAKDIPVANIHYAVIDTNYVTPAVINDADVLIPDRAAIGSLLVKVFGPDYNH